MQLSKADLIEIIRESRRDPAKEAKDQAEADRQNSRRAQMVKIARADEKARKSRESQCQHKKPNGEETSGGQEFSDGRVRIFCLRCQKVLREYWAPAVAQGMAIAAKMGALGVTDEDIRKFMDFKGEGDPNKDVADDFALGMPKGNFAPDLTTESI
jgi:hypothetical protein